MLSVGTHAAIDAATRCEDSQFSAGECTRMPSGRHARTKGSAFMRMESPISATFTGILKAISFDSGAMTTNYWRLTAFSSVLNVWATTENEFVVVGSTDRKQILAGFLEPVTAIKPLRTDIFAPHAHPQRAWAVA